MEIDFFDENCQSHTKAAKFGLCDEPPPSTNPAYIDLKDVNQWIATVENNQHIDIIFTAIDNCIEIYRSDSKMANRCDGMLTYIHTIIFVELKQRKPSGRNYRNLINKAEIQLRSTISVFIRNKNSEKFVTKRAYIANAKKPEFQQSHKERMQRFKDDTGFILKIENKIIITDHTSFSTHSSDNP